MIAKQFFHEMDQLGVFFVEKCGNYSVFQRICIGPVQSTAIAFQEDGHFDTIVFLLET